MEIAGACVVVTGGASGIGRALAERFAVEGARGIVVADLNEEWAVKAAERVGGLGIGCDVADPGGIAMTVAAAEQRFGPVDVFCSNAGYSDTTTWDVSLPMEEFARITRVNMLAHVAAARLVLPAMAVRGSGYLLQTLSSAALISGPAAAGYTMTKFGALGFAEWVAVHYRDRGVRVSCLCPNAVYTGMFGRPLDLDAPVQLPEQGVLGEILLPEDVAVQTVEAMEGDERFLILPHPRVGESFRRKAGDYDAWIGHTAERIARMRASL